MKLSTLLLSLIPGVSRIHHGSARGGILVFFLFAFFLNGFLIAPFLVSSKALRIAMLLGAVLVWMLAFYDGIRVGAAESRPAGRPEPERERVYDDR